MGRVENFLNNIIDKYRHHISIKAEKIKISDNRRQDIIKGFELTDEQKKRIDDFYLENYGKKIPYDWHRLYSSYTGTFDEKYLPELLFIPEVERLLVDRNYLKAFANKNLLSHITSMSDKIKTPEIIISCEKDIYRNSSYQFISFDEAVRLISNIGPAFLKPTQESNSGRGCMIIDMQNGIDTKSGKNASQIINEAGSFFNIQRLVKNSEEISRLHPSSLNTFRITTYIWKNKIYHFPLLMRIGIGGNNLDNAHQGGMFIGVSDDGELSDCAYTEFQTRYYEHPDTGVKFKGYKIPLVKKMVEACEELHQTIPQVGMISWDATIDENNNIFIIEMNLEGQTIWMSQMANGKGAFGENTADILKWISGR